MADLWNEPTFDRCKQNAEKSATCHTKQELLEYYSQWSNKYEEDFRPEHYVGPQLVAKAVAEYIPMEKRSSVTILDIAAGTGLVGLELSKLGFQQIDALDASESMLSRLREKNIYNNTIQAMFDDEPIDIGDNLYDVITSSGGFVPGHLPQSAILEFIRMCKPGGLIVIVMRYEYLNICEDYNGMEQLMEELEVKDKRWKKLRKTVVSNYLLDKDGIVFVYEKI